MLTPHGAVGIRLGTLSVAYHGGRKREVVGSQPSLAEILQDESAVSRGQDIWGGNISRTRRFME